MGTSGNLNLFIGLNDFLNRLEPPRVERINGSGSISDLISFSRANLFSRGQFSLAKYIIFCPNLHRFSWTPQFRSKDVIFSRYATASATDKQNYLLFSNKAKTPHWTTGMNIILHFIDRPVHKRLIFKVLIRKSTLDSPNTFFFFRH